jgi:hypothetical protein
MHFTDNLVLNNEWVEPIPTKQKENNMRITRNSVENMSPQEFFDHLKAFSVKGDVENALKLTGEYIKKIHADEKKKNPEVVDKQENNSSQGHYSNGYYVSNSRSSLANMQIEEI